MQHPTRTLSLVTRGAALPQAVRNSSLWLPGNVSDIMDRWTLQMGFPLVTVNTLDGSIRQNHFLLDRDSVVERPSVFK